MGLHKERRPVLAPEYLEGPDAEPVGGGGGGGLPFFSQLFGFAGAGTLVVQAYGPYAGSALVDSGTPLANDDTERQASKWLSATNIGFRDNGGGFAPPAGAGVYGSFGTKMLLATGGVGYIGFQDDGSVPTAAALDQPGACVRIEQGVGWKFQTWGTALEETVLAQAEDGAWHDVEIFTLDGLEWVLKIDGIEVARHSGNVPAATDLMSYMVWCPTAGSGAKSLYSSYVNVHAYAKPQ